MHAPQISNESNSASRKINFFDIHNEAIQIAGELKSNYLQMFEILVTVESHRIYQQFEVPSLYLYCVELLELSPQLAKDFICVVRKSFEVPELATAVRSQRLTISKARKICSVISSTDFKQWIELAETCSCRVIEKAVAAANPRAGVYETMEYVSEDVLEFKLAVSEMWVQLLAQTNDLLSQQYNRAISSEEALLILMSKHIEKNDPLLKAQRAVCKSKSMSKLKSKLELNNAGIVDSAESKIESARSVPMTTRGESRKEVQSSSKPTRYISASVVHLINLRDERQCTHKDANGKRCQSKRWLQFHHRIEFAKGGSNELENLETLCSAHHRIRHLQELH